MRKLVLLAAVCALALPLFATEPNPSQQQRALLEKLIVLTNLDQGTRSIADAFFAEAEKEFVQQSQDPAEAKELFQSFRAAAAKLDFGALMNEEFIRIYAKYFTEQELADLVAFYSTPTGRKAVEVMDDLVREGMQLGVQRIAPKIEELMQQVREEHEKKYPWRRTMTHMRRVATALEAYSLDHDERYPAGDYNALEALLVPDYLDEFPRTDMWGHSFAYVVSPDGKHYRLVSAGADSIFEWDSRRIAPNPEETRYRERPEDDIIFADLTFVQAPVQAKPKEDQ